MGTVASSLPGGLEQGAVVRGSVCTQLFMVSAVPPSWDPAHDETGVRWRFCQALLREFRLPYSKMDSGPSAPNTNIQRRLDSKAQEGGQQCPHPGSLPPPPCSQPHPSFPTLSFTALALVSRTPDPAELTLL